MNVLFIAFGITPNYLSLLESSLHSPYRLYVCSGEDIEETENRKILKTTGASINSVNSRIKSWLTFYSDVKRETKKIGDNIDVIFATCNPPINSYIGVRLKKSLMQSLFT